MNIFGKALNMVGLQSTEGTKVRIQELEKSVEEGQALAQSQFAEITMLRKELFQVKTAHKTEVDALKLVNEGHIAARTRMEFKINEAKMTLQRTLDEESL